MRSGFLALCGLMLSSVCLRAQDNSPPVIRTQPAGVVAFVGDAVTLSAVIEGSAPLTLQWQKNSVAIPGATNAAYTLSAVSLSDLGLYHLVATNPFGSVATLPALVQVTKRPQTITLEPSNTTAVAGSGIALTATSSANLPVTLTLVSGTATLNGTTLIGSGGTVIVRATQAGNETIAPADPVERTYAFVAGAVSPFITSPPADQTVNAGTSITLRGTAIGTPIPTYQWQKDGQDIAGATSSALTLASPTLSDAGRYTLVARNTSGTATASAILTVRAAPTIATEPASRTVYAGEAASFSVTATGVPAPTFQWRRNGAPIAGATNRTLTFPSALAADAGSYEVVATNALGSATSTAATLTVTTRDFAGSYSGPLAGTTGEFALLVRENRTGVLLVTLPALRTGLVFSNVGIDLAGNFTATGSTMGATPQNVTVRGAIDDMSGRVSGTLNLADATFEGIRGARTGIASGLTGYYQVAFAGTAATRGHFVVAPDGRVLFLGTDGATVDAARGTFNEDGRAVLSFATMAEITLAISDGIVTGTARTSGGSASLSGAIETRLGTERLINLSIRSITSPGAATLITGFVVSGTTPKQLLIRAAGPALAVAPFNVQNALPDPTLQVFRGNNAIGQNDDWGVPAANAASLTTAMTRAGAFPFRAGSQDAALLMTLAPGAYTVVVAGGTGTTLAEVYELLENNETAGARRLVNVSARGAVTPASPFIAGFVVSGPAPRRVLIRGVGPTLAAAPFNVAGALTNPQLTLLRGTATVKTNDDWFRDADAAQIRDAAARAGAFPLGASSADAAMVVYLEPGAYTAQIAGSSVNATGVVLIEIYEAAP